MDMGLSGRPTLVAAASRGLGKACALSLAAEGASVAICAREQPALDAAKEEIAGATGSDVVAIPADVSTEADARRFVREAADQLGGCQILVANAGGPDTGRFEDLQEDDFRAALDLNLFSTLWMAWEAIPMMREAGYGRIVVISSIAVKQPIPNLVLSNSVRAAVIGWAKTLSDEVATDGITVNAVMPGRVMTDRVRWLMQQRLGGQGTADDQAVDEALKQEATTIPVGRFGRPEEVGDVVTFLASERGAYVTGVSLLIDGGLYRGVL
jgi:3-oxoacyl-[acyl-carrier protein] reductase